METLKFCPHCRQPLPKDAPEGLCPTCLAKAGLSTQPNPGGALSLNTAGIPKRELPTPGMAFGGYRIERELGRGGMGAVYEAEHLESGRRVALKVLSHQLDSPEAQARFLREGRLAASINHPNSVYVFGTETINGTPAIVMELVAGGTLQDRVQRQGKLPVGEAVDAILQVIAGLEAAQAIGILHRDIKPANCFQDAQGTVKIGDFGLSISTAARAEANLTLQGTFLGTPAFSSPEQLRGEELNVRSDMYSVGITLFYLLTGRTPYEADNMVKLVAQVLEQPVPSPRKFRPDLPRALAAVVQRCLEKHPTERFKSYNELSQALAPFRSEAPMPAPLGLRFAAGVVDSILLGAVGTVIGLTFGFGFSSFLDIASQFSPRFLRAMAAGFFVMLAYYTVLEGLWGASAGKALCRLRVARPNRNPPGLAKSLARASIYLLLPPLPYWIATGFNPYRFMTQHDPVVTNAMSLFYYLLMASLFITARRRNGFAALQDLLTGTRVIRKPAFQARPVLSVPEVKPAFTPSQPTLGPYHVLETLDKKADGEWLLGYDTRLLRRIWLHQVPVGTPPVPPQLRNLGRIGRLRWITGRRSPTENWDAFEAATGDSLLNLASQAHPWSEVRFWLMDLAAEMEAAQKDGTLPGTLALDRVWVTSDGRAKLLDFPAPGLLAPASVALKEPLAPSVSGTETTRFLTQVANVVLPTSHRRTTLTSSGQTAAPMPLHARTFLNQMPALPSVNAIILELKPLLSSPATVSRGRRAALILGCAAFPVLAGLGFAVAGRVMSDWQKQQPEIASLNVLLQERSLTRSPWIKDGHKGPDDKTLAIYIAHNYRNVITNPASWSGVYATATITGEHRKFAEDSLKTYPNPREDEIRAATAVVKPYLSKQAPFDPFGMPFFPLVVAGACLVVYVGLPALVAALLFRGGPLLRLLGLAVVRRDGERASRLRVLWRGLIAWSPFLATPFLAMALTPFAGAGWRAVIVLAFLALCVGWSLSLPNRGLPDRLAGTCLVNR